MHELDGLEADVVLLGEVLRFDTVIGGAIVAASRLLCLGFGDWIQVAEDAGEEVNNAILYEPSLLVEIARDPADQLGEAFKLGSRGRRVSDIFDDVRNVWKR